MKLREISAYGHQLTRFGLFNCYLVRESDSFTLIGTTMAGGARRIIEAAHRIAMEPIERLLLTHAHGDHIGSLDALAAALGQHPNSIQVAVGAREARLLPKKPAQDRSLDPGEPQCRVKGSFPGAATAPTHLLCPASSSSEGQDEGELYGSLRVLATPGHLSFFDERDGTLYAGDALVLVGGKVHVSGFGPWYFPLPAMATWHRPTALASARRLLDLPIRLYAAGHGRVVEGGPDLLAASIRRAEASLR